MSWEDSDKDKNKDPWGNRKNQQTPPDLDDIIKSAQEKLGGLFGGGGGKKSSGGTKAPQGPSGMGISLILVVGVIVWLASGIYIVDEGTRGVVLRFGAFHEITLPGPHWRLPTPVDKTILVNVDQQRFVEIGYRSNAGQQGASAVRKEALMLTEDENIIDVRLAVQYRIKDAQDYIFNVRSPDLTLKQATESALRAVIGKSKMDFVLTEGRSDVVAKVRAELQIMLDAYVAGIEVTSVNLVEAQPPEEVQGAFSDAIKAREDEQRFINESQAYANEVIPKARGAASRLVQESEAYKARVQSEAEGDASRFTQLLVAYEAAPEVTRKRLYLETMESVLGEANKVVMDVKGGNNVMYLPLDKMVSGSQSATKTTRFSAPTETNPNASSGFNRPSSTRDRDGRGR